LLLPPKKEASFSFELHHVTDSGEPVASKSEACIHNALWAKRDLLNFIYNQRLDSKRGAYPRWPDFTIYQQGRVIYWEHAGKLSDESYDENFKKKQKWYQNEGLADRLLVSHELEGINTKLINEVIDLLIKNDLAGARRILDPNIHRGMR
jgi:hypothetical protein